MHIQLHWGLFIKFNIAIFTVLLIQFVSNEISNSFFCKKIIKTPYSHPINPTKQQQPPSSKKNLPHHLFLYLLYVLSGYIAWHIGISWLKHFLLMGEAYWLRTKLIINVVSSSWIASEWADFLHSGKKSPCSRVHVHLYPLYILKEVVSTYLKCG